VPSPQRLWVRVSGSNIPNAANELIQIGSNTYNTTRESAQHKMSKEGGADERRAGFIIIFQRAAVVSFFLQPIYDNNG
jgi:hypothetical protein